MRLSLPPLLLACGLSLVSLGVADEPPAPPSAEAVRAAFDLFIQTGVATNWQGVGLAREKLVALGPDAVPLLVEGARTHPVGRARSSCFDVLIRSFKDDERTADAMYQSGLLDAERDVRYSCAFQLGELKVKRAVPALRLALKTWSGKDEDHLRFTAAKSLAELGSNYGLMTLVQAASNDRYMARYMADIGLKAISGKSLGDFHGYQFGEGQFVIGGLEYQTWEDPLVTAERNARRFQALASYLRWLKEERPDLDEAMYPRRQSRRAAKPG